MFDIAIGLEVLVVAKFRVFIAATSTVVASLVFTWDVAAYSVVSVLFSVCQKKDSVASGKARNVVGFSI